MGFLSSTKKVTQSNTLLGPTKESSDYLNRQGLRVAKKKFVPFTGQRIAGLTDAQREATDLARRGAANPFDFTEARDYARRGSLSWADADDATRSKYINPFTRMVTDDTMRRLTERMAQTNRDWESKDVARGAFYNNSRLANERALRGSEQDRVAAETVNNLNRQAYDSATGMWSADRGRNLNTAGALAGMGSQESAQRLADIGALLQAGGIEQGTNQAGLDAKFAEFMRENNFDWDQLMRLGQVTQMAPDETQSTTVQKSSMNPLQAALGIASAASGLGLFGGAAGALGGAGAAGAAGAGGALSSIAPMFAWPALDAGIPTFAQSMANYSDRRLKTAIKRIGESAAGLGIYAFRYLWDADEVVRYGVMADEVEKVKPEAVSRDSNGYAMVDYSMVFGGSNA